MFNRKKIKELENEIKEYKKKIDELKFQSQAYKIAYDRLAEEKEELRLKKTKKMLEDYNYAILIKDYKVELWNEDRYEEHVKEILFNAHPGEIPELNIIK